MSWIDIVTVISSLSAVAAVVVSIIAIITDAKRSRAVYQLGVSMDFFNRFHEVKMAERRKVASAFLRKRRDIPFDSPEWNDASDVLDFFQVVGTVARSGYLDPKVLYKLLFYWLTHYRNACCDYIEFQQKATPIVWQDMEWLYQQLVICDQQLNAGALSRLSPEQLDEFFTWEMENLASKESRSREGLA